MHIIAACAVWHFGWDCATVWVGGHGQAERGMKNICLLTYLKESLGALRPGRGGHTPMLWTGCSAQLSISSHTRGPSKQRKHPGFWLVS